MREAHNYNWLTCPYHSSRRKDERIKEQRAICSPNDAPKITPHQWRTPHFFWAGAPNDQRLAKSQFNLRKSLHGLTREDSIVLISTLHFYKWKRPWLFEHDERPRLTFDFLLPNSTFMRFFWCYGWVCNGQIKNQI